ncbi:hypothetical protein EG327_005148 [Venturia inaequalis]|uniref:Uncharacterized protein n=1 Tax=Venturia inaequalis TaxID=5025 RepID=A0A8H3VW99_VENIN|nr:hypothetical protein EG327_005148 [Venturia inaequalis]
MPQIQGPLPTLLHTTTPISLSTAKSWLSAYTTLSETHPHHHPNSTFTPDRLEFSSHGPEGGITMHLLRRIVAGLGGEVLEPMKEDEEGEERVLDSQGTTGGEGEDPESFARKRGEEGEVGERSNFVAVVGEEPEVHADADAEADVVDDGVRVVSKEDRKAAKKAKRQAEKREKNEKNKKVKRED